MSATFDWENQTEGEEKVVAYGVPVDEVDLDIRRGFVRKVFATLALQLAVTFTIISIFSLHEPVRAYVDLRTDEGHVWVFAAGTIVSLVCLLTLACCAHQARTHPNNLIFLGGFTLAESIVLGVICAAYTLESVLLAMGITVALVAGLVAYASTTRTDFTGAGPYLFVGLLSLVFYGLAMAALPSIFLSNLTHTAYTYLGVVLFSFYLIFDTQLILGGKHHKFRFGVDEHIFASLNIYLDIVNLFIKILRLVGRERGD